MESNEGCLRWGNVAGDAGPHPRFLYLERGRRTKARGKGEQLEEAIPDSFMDMEPPQADVSSEHLWPPGDC